MHAGEEDHARPGWTTSRRGQDSPWKSQSEWQRTEINGESRPTSSVWPTLRSRTAEERRAECQIVDSVTFAMSRPCVWFVVVRLQCTVHRCVLAYLADALRLCDSGQTQLNHIWIVSGDHRVYLSVGRPDKVRRRVKSGRIRPIKAPRHCIISSCKCTGCVVKTAGNNQLSLLLLLLFY